MLSLALLLVLGEIAPAELDPPEFGAGACQAAAARTLVGKRPSNAMIEQARVRSGAKLVRSLKWGLAYTDDYRTDRLNIHFNRKGRVSRVNCG